MAPSKAMKQSWPETLPADFAAWDDTELPSTLPPDFREFDSSPEGEEVPAAVSSIPRPTPSHALQGSVIFAPSKPRVVDENEEENPEEQRKSRRGWIIGGVGATVLLGCTVTYILAKHTPVGTSEKHIAIPAKQSTQSPAVIGKERPSPSRHAAGDNPASKQANTPEVEQASITRDAGLNYAGMQSQLNTPSRISSDIKSPGPPDAAPASEFNSSGVEALGDSASAGNVFAGKQGAQVSAYLPGRVDVSPAQAMGMLIHRVDPTYPSIAKNARSTGTVKLQVVIGKDGNVRELHVTEGPKLLRDAAAQAVKSWRFHPYTIANQPTEMQTTLSIYFHLAQ